jgi:cysteine-rich repeat protein
MKALRLLLPLAGVASLALVLSHSVRHVDPVETPEARPSFLQERPLAPTGPPEGIITRVVPNVVEQVEPRVRYTPAALEILPKVSQTEMPGPSRKQPVDLDAPASDSFLELTPNGRIDDRERAPAEVTGYGYAWDSFDIGDSGAVPPDPHAAAGPAHVMNVINSLFAIYQKDGTLSTSGTLYSFFTPIATTGTYDPRVIYDTIHERFVVIALEYFTVGSTRHSNILAAVSDDSDPTGTWYLQKIDALTVISSEWRWADYPTLAADEDNVYVTANMLGVITGTFGNSLIFVIEKGSGTGGFYDGGNASVKKVLPPQSSGDYDNLTLQPVDMVTAHPDPTVGTFFLSYNGQNDGTDRLLKVMTMTDPLSIPTLTVEFVNIGTPDQSGGVPNAPQAAGASLETDKRSIMDAAWRDHELYAVTTLKASSQATAHWFQLDTTTLFDTTVIDQGDVDGEDITTATHTFYPSIAVDSGGRIGIGFAASGTAMFPGTYFTFRLPTDPPGTVQPSETIQAGNAAYVILDGTRNRWGDYSGIDQDPVEDCFWVYNEYAKSANFWGTAYGQYCLDFVCGNGAVEPGENCDPPGEPPGAPDVCREDCFYCGDGQFQPAYEECEDGGNVDGDGCDRNCNYEYCGNGVLQIGEKCDPPGTPAGGPDECRFDCSYCGDGNVDPGGGNLVANGGFDLGSLSAWNVHADGDGDFFVDNPGTTTPISGRDTRPKLGSGPYYAVSDSEHAGMHAIVQPFTVPADASSVVISFDMFANNWSFGGTWIHAAGLDWTVLPDANQHARVDLLNPGFPPFDTSGAVVVDNLYIGADTGTNPNNFTSYNFDITSDVVPGQSYELRFAEVSNQDELNLGVNLVKIQVATPAEGCDDGNNVGGDTCSSTCELCTTAPFVQTVRAIEGGTFFWDSAVDTFYAVGDLADVGLYTPTSTGSMTFVTSFDVTATPAPGEGIYTLFRVDCPGASWDSGGPGQCCARPLP